MSLQKPGTWKKQAVNSAEFDAWDYALRCKLGFFTGLKFFQRHSSQSRTAWTVAARHWPHKLCWDWCIHWTPWSEHYDGPHRLRVWLPRYGSTGFECWFGRLHLSWQDDGWMGAVGPLGVGAPKIIWKHQIDTAAKADRDRALAR